MSLFGKINRTLLIKVGAWYLLCFWIRLCDFCHTVILVFSLICFCVPDGIFRRGSCSLHQLLVLTSTSCSVRRDRQWFSWPPLWGLCSCPPDPDFSVSFVRRFISFLARLTPASSPVVCLHTGQCLVQKRARKHLRKLSNRLEANAGTSPGTSRSRPELFFLVPGSTGQCWGVPIFCLKVPAEYRSCFF